MSLVDRIRQQFEDSAELTRAAAAQLTGPIAQAAELLTTALAADRKLLICGNGGSAAASQRMAAELVGRFERDRPELAAIALCADTAALTGLASEYGIEQVFARQVRALGREGDVLVAISAGGDAGNVLAAVQAAHERGLGVVALTGCGGGRIGAALRAGDIHLCVPHDRPARIQEVHLLMIHCLCDGIDASLLGD